MPPVLHLLVAGLGTILGLLIGRSRRRWRTLTERERFMLGLKEAATPEKMRPEERRRLKRLRSPWWAVWRWLPDAYWTEPP